MPSNRRQRPYRRRADVQELTVWQWYDLLRGNPLITGLGFSDDDELADAWLTHGDRVMDLWLRHFPGRRAFGWWLVEAPEERRLLPDLCPVTLANLDNWREHGILCSDCLQEPEWDFLSRHGLLTREEAAYPMTQR